MSTALPFLQITAKHQDSFFTTFLTTKTSSQNISITLLQSSLNLHEHQIIKVPFTGPFFALPYHSFSMINSYSEFYQKVEANYSII